MKAIVAAVHGILTSQTDASWPDQFDAWMFEHDPEMKVLKKKYLAGPFPHWNCWVKDPLLARGLANELELFLRKACANGAGGQPRPAPTSANLTCPPLWFVAHSNGAVIALLAAKRLIDRGYQIGGLILTGAALEADLEQNGLLAWCSSGPPADCPGCHLEGDTPRRVGAAIAYCSAEDEVVAGDARADRNMWSRMRDWLWGKLMWPYGCLGRTGWLWRGEPATPSAGAAEGEKVLAALGDPQVPAGATTEADPTAHQPVPMIFTRWYAGGHSAYFRPQNIERVFERIYDDITECTACGDCVLPKA